MPVLLQYVAQTRVSPEDHSTRLALRCLGTGMVGPLRMGRSGFMHVLVAVDKFTKWIEAKPIKNLDACTAISFIRKLIFRYGVPHSVITDNGSNFDSDKLRAFCASQGTRVDYASVAHPSRVDKQKEQTA